MKKIKMPNDTFCIPDTANLLNDNPSNASSRPFDTDTDYAAARRCTFGVRLTEKQQKDLDAIVKVLECSDIVWTRYGTETIQDLALKILKSTKE